MVTVDATQIESCPQTQQLSGKLERLRIAQAKWAMSSLTQRLKVVKRFRHALARDAEQLAQLIELPQRNLADSIAAEVMPLADACRFLERNANRLLATRSADRSDRPAWGRGLKVKVHRDPYGTVLIIGTWNYPLFLTGVQTLQALVAGNAVLIKPGEGTAKVTRHVVQLLYASGLSEELIHVLPEDPNQARQAMELGIGKVVFTGSAETGRSVLGQLAKTTTPSVMELSGSDAVFILPGANVKLAAKCVAFGLRMNGSATCIAPRRVFVTPSNYDAFKDQLAIQVPLGSSAPVHPKAGQTATRLIDSAIEAGAKLVLPANRNPWLTDEQFPTTILEFTDADHELLRSDVFVPLASVICVRDQEQALSMDALCPYALGATVFGPAVDANRFAQRIDAGCVVVNDIIAPTADPRVPFGGRKGSGFGVTRGAEGLLELTQIKTIVTQTSGWLPHLERPVPELSQLLIGFLRMNHGATWSEKWKAMCGLAEAGRAYWKAMKNKKE